MIHQILTETGNKHPFVDEEKELFTRALRIFYEAGIEKYKRKRENRKRKQNLQSEI